MQKFHAQITINDPQESLVEILINWPWQAQLVVILTLSSMVFFYVLKRFPAPVVTVQTGGKETRNLVEFAEAITDAKRQVERANKDLEDFKHRYERYMDGVREICAAIQNGTTRAGLRRMAKRVLDRMDELEGKNNNT